ncbi:MULTISPECIES: mechanosensitive ion channel family protein [unclassified Fibrobacter]|uniref:mechanosensitive ion channel family protein n=1 Tax=unclassified Fibrobacter TaxID=2634177 RepID=UPI000D7AC923|nr:MULTISPECIES: mechanosensitive ion channel family protein [unclassified Fibrobacter]PWJ56874.1 small conductance mechanosensitive channel [Fibrobacter sp. UWR4]PZW62344.1 small conductance mechanosensitive channel [Fibrobacter sp. UWR1]
MEKLQAYLTEYPIVKQVLLVILVFLAVKVFVWSFRKFLVRMSKRGMDPAAIPLITDLVKYVVYISGLIIALNIFGVNTTGIVAMISAASLAIGFALKDTLSNIASGIVLLFLKPFKAGDLIECGSIRGKILGIGLFNTTLETLDGLYVSAPNSSLWGAPIVNFSKNPHRRLDITVGVSYDSSLDLVMARLREMVEAEAHFLKDPAPAFFVSALEDSAVNVTVRVWVNSGDYGTLLQRYNEAIKRLFDENGIEIPYPQRVIHVHGDGSTVSIEK